MTTFIPIDCKLRAMGYKLIAGMDEVGRGPLAGPVVCAVVVLKENAVIPGLKDSKLLKSGERLRLFDVILKNSLDYAITLVSHKTIDRTNILNSVRMANHLCLENLKIKPDLVVIDGREKQFINERYVNVIKGDIIVKEVAAASVLAKVVRDKIMEKYALEFGFYEFERNKGYGSLKHMEMIKKYGQCEIHRKSFNIKPEQLSIEL